jgi:uncharacterized membrane protein YhdT
MNISPTERALLPLIGLQGAVSTLAGFIGFFVIEAHGMNGMLRFTAGMLTAAIASTLLAYRFGPLLKLTGGRLLKLGFIGPGLPILFGHGGVASMALAFGAFLGLTWGARHWLEMSLLNDAERDRYAAHSGTVTVISAVATTLLASLLLLLAGGADQGRYVYPLYGMLAIIGGLVLGSAIPDTAPVSLDRPLAVIRQPQFIACLPLFFLESGLFGLSQALGSAGAVKALGSASQFGWVATLAGLVGGVALYLTRKTRDMHNRSHWLGASCLVVAVSFVLLGASVWVPALYVGYSILKAAGGPFLAASEQVLNQRTLDIRGRLSDRIVAREVVLWALRMLSLLLFWLLAATLPSNALLVAGSLLLALATGTEYLIGKTWFGHGGAAAGRAVGAA